jgi:hypothetical protein
VYISPASLSAKHLAMTKSISHHDDDQDGSHLGIAIALTMFIAIEKALKRPRETRPRDKVRIIIQHDNMLSLRE